MSTPLIGTKGEGDLGRECDLLGITHGGVAVEGVSRGEQLDLVL